MFKRSKDRSNWPLNIFQKSSPQTVKIGKGKLLAVKPVPGEPPHDFTVHIFIIGKYRCNIYDNSCGNHIIDIMSLTQLLEKTMPKLGEQCDFFPTFEIANHRRISTLEASALNAPIQHMDRFVIGDIIDGGRSNYLKDEFLERVETAIYRRVGFCLSKKALEINYKEFISLIKRQISLMDSNQLLHKYKPNINNVADRDNINNQLAKHVFDEVKNGTQLIKIDNNNLMSKYKVNNFIDEVVLYYTDRSKVDPVYKKIIARLCKVPVKSTYSEPAIHGYPSTNNLDHALKLYYKDHPDEKKNINRQVHLLEPLDINKTSANSIKSETPDRKTESKSIEQPNRANKKKKPAVVDSPITSNEKIEENVPLDMYERFEQFWNENPQVGYDPHGYYLFCTLFDYDPQIINDPILFKKWAEGNGRRKRRKDI